MYIPQLDYQSSLMDTWVVSIFSLLWIVLHLWTLVFNYSYDYLFSVLWGMYIGVGKWSKVFVAQSCLTLGDPMNYSPPGSSVHRIFQARILEWVAMPSSRGSSWPRDWTCVLCRETLFLPIQISLNNFCHSDNLDGSKYDRHWKLCGISEKWL